MLACILNIEKSLPSVESSRRISGIDIILAPRVAATKLGNLASGQRRKKFAVDLPKL